MKKFYLPILMVSAALYLSACNGVSQENDDQDSTRTTFIDTAGMDIYTKPGENFWMYANGNWYKNTEIPATESSQGSFYDLRNTTRENLKIILADVSAVKHDPGTTEQLVGDFYASGMDTVAIDQRGIEPIKPTLEEIEKISTTDGVMMFVADQQTEQNSLLFNFGVGIDDKNSNQYLPVLDQGGLGLPDRDYYFKTDETTQEIVNAYKEYINKLLLLAGTDTVLAANMVEKVYSIEKQLAEGQKTRVELRDPEANYNKTALKDLDKLYPNLQLAEVLKAMRVNTDSINVRQPRYLKTLDKLISQVPPTDWKDYLRVHILDNAAPFLSSNFRKANFNYVGKAISGQQEQKPRWQTMISRTDLELGDALSQLYVKKYFTESSRKKMLELVANLKKAFENRLNKLDWMSEETRQKALEKLHAISDKIGFPDKWRDYKGVTIDRTKFFENMESLDKYAYNYDLNRLGKPVDRSEWPLTPATVNAGYLPAFNDIVFPAAILQYPFFDINADDAVNYGAIGAGIGHEMTHGFDDEGSQYDKDGNLKSWWTATDRKRFEEKGKKLVDLYDSFTVLDTVHVNGALTEGENIADFGGLAIAYDAFKMTPQGQDTTRIDGFTPDQRFFLAFARIWRGKRREKELFNLVKTDPHSPEMFRVNGPLMNFEPFYKAFDIKPGDKMYVAEADRVKVW